MPQRPLRIVFCGATGFSRRCLERLLMVPEVVVAGVVTNAETFSISYRPSMRNVLHEDLRPAAAAAGIPCWEMTGKMSDPALVEHLAEWVPDVMLVVGWYHIVPRSVRVLAPALGMHASLLPDYSGGAPLVWAMINGESRTGITLFWLGDGVDDGPIIGQIAVPIALTDTIATLYEKIEAAGLCLLDRHLPELAAGTATATVQDETRRRRMPQRAPADGRIDWSWSARRVYDFVRAQTRPYPGAFTSLRGTAVTVWSAYLCDESPEPAHPPGAIRLGGPSASDVMIACGDGHWLAVREVGFETGECLPARELAVRLGLFDGERVGDG